MPKVAPEILPLMLKIFTNSQQYSVRTRGRAAQIFAICVKVISGMLENEETLNKHLPNLPEFTQALVQSLGTPDTHISNSLKKDVINALKTLIKSDEMLTVWLPSALNHTLVSLGNDTHLFINAIVSGGRGSNDAVDSDGESEGFQSLVMTILDFIICVVQNSSKCRDTLLKFVPSLVYYLIFNMQITEEQVNIWNTDVERFGECEQGNPSAYSVRISSQELLKLIALQFKEEMTVGLCGAIVRCIQEIDTRPSNKQWWKIHEACMVALEIVHEYVTDQLLAQKLQFDITGFLQSVLLKDMCTAVSPFLLGRCLAAGSCYLTFMDVGSTQIFLQAIVNGLKQSYHQCIIVCAARAVCRVCDHFKSTKKPEILLPYLPSMFEDLHIFLQERSSSLFVASELLNLALESIAMVISVDENFTCSIEKKIVPLTINFWKRNDDPTLLENIKEIVKHLCRFPHCLQSLHQTLLLELLSVMQQQDKSIPPELRVVSLDLLLTIVKHSPLPLSETMIMQAFPAVVYCILHADDSMIFQNGCECLQAFILTSMDQIALWKDAEGRTGLQYIYNVIEIILNPSTAESAATCMGGLISALIYKDCLGTMTDQFFRMMVNKMQHVRSFSATQTLVMIFSRMFLINMENTLTFLASVTFPDGQSALNYVLTKWCTCHYMFLGVKDSQVSAFSLSKILEYCIKTNDANIQAMEVHDPKFIADNVVRTRSQSVQNRASQLEKIPLPVKIHKILIQELYHLYVADEDSNTEEEENKMSSLYTPTTKPAQKEEQKNDFDVLQDPLHGMNFKEYLINFLMSLSQIPSYNSLTNYMTQHEKEILPVFNIPC